MKQATLHTGTSFVEIYQNCIVFNPTEWEGLDDHRVREESSLYLEHDKPLVFGKNRDKGIRLKGFTPEIANLNNGVSEECLVVHDVTSKQLAYILSDMEFPEYPALMGVIYQEERSHYSQSLLAQVKQARKEKNNGNLDNLYRSAEFWTVPSSDAGEVRE